MTKKLEKILYVEDDEDIAELTTMTLSSIGNFDVKHCSSGQEALDSVAEFKPQLILMDMMMPGMDGLQTLEEFRKKDVSKNVPVIFMTAKAQSHEQQNYKEKGALGVIVKPCEPVALCDHLQKYWEQHQNE